jgi:magnesium-transporting ATPase (P-type)
MVLRDCHSCTIEHATEQLKTHIEHGLTQERSQDSPRQHGPNEMREKPRPGFGACCSPVHNFLIIILIFAAVVSSSWEKLRCLRHHGNRHSERLWGSSKSQR